MIDTIIIDGKKIAEEFNKEIIKNVNKMKERNVVPQLVIISIGNDPASKIYISHKIKAAEKLNMKCTVNHYEEDVDEEVLYETIDRLNRNVKVAGIIVQLPLPKHISFSRVAMSISKTKDVDCFNPHNVGDLYMDILPLFVPCTPLACKKILEYHDFNSNKFNHMVIVGRSNIVGRPCAGLFLQNNTFGNYTVTVCHSHTKNLKDITQTADILIAAIGKPNFITSDMIKENSVILDVGINRSENNKLIGDVDKNVIGKAHAITPVPGGVGPMTVAMLMNNLCRASEYNFEQY